MITMRKFPLGRVGNNLFEIAFIRATALRLRTEWKLPKWELLNYFQMTWNEYKGEATPESFIEPSSGYHPDIKRLKPKGNLNVYGYFQSEKYFEQYWHKFKNEFRWKDWFIDEIRERSRFTPKEGDVAVHVRRGDYVNNPNYLNIVPSYYAEYFEAHPELNFYIFSDDYKYCKMQFHIYRNVEFVENCKPIEHLCLMSQFQNHMIANSSFSWWGAKLAELYHDKVNVIRPNGLTAGELYTRYEGRFFYPMRWTKRNFMFQLPKKEVKKRNLMDVTFIIPVRLDSTERMENLNLVLKYLLHHFNTNIIVGEQGSGRAFEKVQNMGVKYVCFDEMREFMYKCEDAFWRTRMLNYMTMISKTEMIFNWDCDVLVHHDNIYKAVYMMRYGCDFVYPYDGRFAHVPREYYASISNCLDVSCVDNIMFDGMQEGHKISYGGAVGFRREAYMKIGMEDENFVSHAPEDWNRKQRILMLTGVEKMADIRTDNPLYHLDHPMLANSKHNNEWVAVNSSEFKKCYKMNKEQLRAYVDTWPWINEYKNMMK